MAYHATVDAAGKLTGFYDDALHPVLPAGAMALTPAQYQSWYSDQTQIWSGGRLVTGPIPVPTTAQALAALDALMLAKQALGVMFQASGATAPRLFPTDPGAQARMTDEFVAANAGLWTDGDPWQASDGTYIAFVKADVLALATKARSYVKACYLRKVALDPQVRANPAADISAGWPSNA